MSQVFSWRSSRHNCYCYKDKSQNFSKRSSSVVTPLTPVGRDTWPRNEGTVRSTCKATTCIRIPGQLDHDLCKPAVNLMPFLLYSRDAITIMFPQAYALTHEFCRKRITSLLWSERLRFVAFVKPRSGTVVHSCAVASFATFCVESPRVQAYAEFTVRGSNSGWSYTCSLPCTTSALRTSTHDNKHTLQYVLHNIDCGSLSFHRWQSRDSWRNTRTRRYLDLGHASTREDSFFWTTEAGH